MSIDRFISHNWLALSLAALHTLLVGTFEWIEINHAWNDQKPTMLVMSALYIVDYPVILLLQPLNNSAEHIGIFLAALMVAGRAFWFIVVTTVNYSFRAAKDGIRC